MVRFTNVNEFIEEYKMRALATYGREAIQLDITEAYDVLATLIRDYMTLSNKECKDKVILKDLLNAGYIEKVKQSNIEEIKNNEEANEEESEYNED